MIAMTVNVERARENLQERYAREEKELDMRFQSAWESFDRIVELLIQKYHPRRIYQWGSLLNRAYFSFISDIDIAVEGIASAETFFAMYGDAEGLTNFPLDLVQIEKIDKLHAQSIREKGRIVYEREK